MFYAEKGKQNIRMKLFQISFQIIFQIRKSELKFKMWQETHTYSKKESETLQSRY